VQPTQPTNAWFAPAVGVNVTVPAPLSSVQFVPVHAPPVTDVATTLPPVPATATTLTVAMNSAVHA
jgi:hypothetical protein